MTPTGDREAEGAGSHEPGILLLLVRHGESTWNAAGRWQGQADPPLTTRGEAQAAAAAARLVADAEQVVTSDLVRARRTAEILAGALALPLRAEPRLRERHGGPWQGCTRAEIDARWPGMLDDGRRPDGYESDERLLARVLDALDGIRVPSVVVTHGGVIRVLEQHLGAPAERVPNLSARMLRRGVDALELGTRVELVADGTVATEAGA